MGNKYQKDLREIVGYDRTRKVLGAAATKENIGPKRGIGYFTADRAGVGSTSGDAPSDGVEGTKLDKTKKEDGTLNSENNTEEKIDQDEETGGLVDPKNPYRSFYDEAENVYDAKDLIDGEDSPSRYTPYDPISGIGGLDDYGNGFLKKLDGLTDCDTGTELEVRVDGTYQPPDTWDDDGTPPDEQEWTSGTSWLAPWAGAGGPSEAATPQAAAEAARDGSGDGDKTDIISVTFDDSFPHTGGTVRYIFSFQNPGDMSTAQYYAQDQSCTPEFGDSVCPTTEPDTIKWPSDSKMQLSLDDGKFKHSKYEPDADEVAKFTDDQHSQIDFCFDSGTRTGAIATTNEGGFMVYETSGGFAKSGTIVRVFDSQGRITGYTDSAGIAAYTP